MLTAVEIPGTGLKVNRTAILVLIKIESWYSVFFVPVLSSCVGKFCGRDVAFISCYSFVVLSLIFSFVSCVAVLISLRRVPGISCIVWEEIRRKPELLLQDHVACQNLAFNRIVVVISTT